MTVNKDSDFSQPLIERLGPVAILPIAGAWTIWQIALH